MTRSLAGLLFLLLSCALLVAQARMPVRVRIGAEYAEGMVVKKVAPVYPPLARQARIQGTVTLQVIVSKEGDVQNIQLFSGHPILAPAAIDAVKQWKYKSYQLNGEPISFETQVKVNFTLAEKPPAEGVVGDIPGGAVPGQTGSIAEGEPASSQIPARKRVRVSAGVMQGLLAKKVAPLYPPDAKNAKIEGTVWLKVIIDKEGNVATVQLISGHPVLAPAAIDAVKEWKYRPYLLNGEPVEVETQVRINFELAG